MKSTGQIRVGNSGFRNCFYGVGLLLVLMICAWTENGRAGVILYEQYFNNSTGGNRNMSTIGWSGYNTVSGVDVSSDSDPVSKGIFVSSTAGNPSTPNGFLALTVTPGFACVTGLNLNDVDTIEWNASVGATYNNTTKYYALAVQVGGNWYGTIPTAIAPVGAISSFSDDAVSVSISPSAVIWYNLNFSAGTSLSLDTSSSVFLPDGTVTGIGFYSAIGATLRIDALQVSAIPETSTCALLVLGLVLLTAFAARRRKAAV